MKSSVDSWWWLIVYLYLIILVGVIFIAVVVGATGEPLARLDEVGR